MNNFITKKQKGFTLIEMMISVFIFALMMTAIGAIFATQIKSYKNARVIQNDLENAQFALNYISKTLRTASLIGYGSKAGGIDLLDNKPPTSTDYTNDFYLKELINPNVGLIVYDFSQEACAIFTFRGSVAGEYEHPALWMESQTGIGINETEKCLEAVYGNTPGGVYKNQRLTTGSVTGVIYAAPTRYQDSYGSRGTDTIGRATVSMKVEPADRNSESDIKPIYIQSSTSLRDYPSDLSF